MAKNIGAQEEALAQLHKAVAEGLLSRIKDGDPKAYGAAIRFLKDNGIECIAERNQTIIALRDSLPDPDAGLDDASDG